MKNKQLYYLHQLIKSSGLNDFERDYVHSCYNLIAADFKLSVRQKNLLKDISKKSF